MSKKPFGQYGLGDGLRKSVSHEPLGQYNDESEDSDSPPGGIRFFSRLQSASMSPLKSHFNKANDDTPEAPTSSKGKNISRAQYGSLEDDDVFVDNRGLNKNRLGASSAGHGDDSSAVDAQGIYSPSACVFVANLPSSESDNALEEQVMETFGKFGKVFVKIRRDARQMPFAFCQYTTDEDAKMAYQYGGGLEICGRFCRVEKAKANSVFVVYKRSGKATDQAEATELLSTLGALSMVEPLSEEMQLELDLPPAMVVKFRMYDPKRDVVKALKFNGTFAVTPLEQSKGAGSAPGSATRLSLTPKNSQKNIMSVYIGNLPVDTSHEEVRELGVSCGQVMNISVKTKSVAEGAVEVCYAFIEFAKPESVEDMISRYDGFSIRGHQLRVAHRHSTDVSARRYASFDPNTPSTSGYATSNSAQYSSPISARKLGEGSSQSWSRGRQSFHARVSGASQTPSKMCEANYADDSEHHHDEFSPPMLGMGSLSLAGSSGNRIYRGNAPQRAGAESFETPVRPSTSRFIEQPPQSAATPRHQHQEGDTPVRQHDAMVKYLDEATRDASSSPAETVERENPNNTAYSASPIAPPMAQAPHVSPYAFGAMNPYMVYPHTPFSPYPSHGMMVPQYSPFYGPAPAFPEMYAPVMYPPPMMAPPAHESNQETPTRVNQTRRRRENNDHASQSDTGRKSA